MENQSQIHPFIQYLFTIAEKEDRGKLAALRRGLGKPPGSDAGMYPIVEPWMPRDPFTEQENAYYLVAALFAFHPAIARQGNMGDHFHQLRSQANNDALERRFTVLLNSTADTLPDTLRMVVSLLKNKDVPVNWNQLFYDIQSWNLESRKVQKSWARAFWWSENTPENADSNIKQQEKE